MSTESFGFLRKGNSIVPDIVIPKHKGCQILVCAANVPTRTDVAVG